VQQGTALVGRLGTAEPIGVTTDQPLNNLPEGSTIGADENVQALLTIRSPDNATTLMTVQIYGSTNLTIDQARSPRFQQSGQPHQLQLRVGGGRLRVTLASDPNRPIEARLMTPQATTDFQEGSYSIEVSNQEMQVTVRDGLATVSAQGDAVALGPSQRTTVQLDSPPDGILSPERDLIVNGNFRQPLADSWQVTSNLQEPSESPGVVTIVTNNGQQAARFERGGTYHADTVLRQIMNKDVRDFRSLNLHFVVQISFQDVPVCGSLGSECPMMVRLEYKDSTGTDRDWIQGFYAVPDTNFPPNPTVCVTCNPPRNEHRRIPPDLSFPYDSGNLMTIISPTQITAITFYASGHSYRSYLSEVELLGEQ
jgi:hypothetical protein